MNNFNCLIAMISGLNLSAVSRLKQTWEGIQPKYMTAIQELEAFASPEHNYKNYRAGLDEIDPEKLDKVGCIPFFGLFVKDLTFVNDGNPARFQKEYINFSKLRIVYDKIVEMQFFQSLPYSLPEVSNVTKEYIDNMRSLKEPALYKYSCLCEAKGGNGTVRMIDKWAKDNKH